MKKIKKRLKKILIGAGFFVAALLIDNLFEIKYVSLAAFLAAYFVIGGDVVKKAVSNIGRGQVFDENFLMTLATVGAFFVGEYHESVAVMLFYQVGELFQSYAVYKSRRSITELMDIRPDYANVLRDGDEVTVSPDEVKLGEKIVVKPGEKVPLDGIIAKGTSTLDTKALTGESLPREVCEGDSVISGCININGILEIEVTKEFASSTVSKILELVENASARKAEAENFITKFARYYTPVVVISALLLAVIPPFFTGLNTFPDWLYRALIFLVISCPCALVISIPLSFFGGLGGASKMGVLIKGSNYLEAIASTETVIMDKTGTLTKGNFKVVSIVPAEGVTKEKLLETAAYAEIYSNHPIAMSLKEEYTASGKNLDNDLVEDARDEAGKGVVTIYNGKTIIAGNKKSMEAHNISYIPNTAIGSVVYVAEDNKFIGSIVIADELKEDAISAITELKREGVKRIVMLTGDRKEVAEQVAASLGVTEVFAELLPGDKVDCFERIISEANKTTVFVGDGVNDAPVLARADVGIAMGGLGQDAAIEAADIVIMNDAPSKIAATIRGARKTIRIVRQNIVFAIGVKVLVMILGALGFANMWAAVFADVGVAVIAILNAMRVLVKFK